MYTLVLKEWHVDLSMIKVSTEAPEVVTLESLAVALGSTESILKGMLEGFSDDGTEVPIGKVLAKQWYTVSTNEGTKDVCTLADAWRLTEMF